MRDPEAAKELAWGWFMNYVRNGAEEGVKGVTPDFRWVMPQSVASIFPGQERVVHGLDGLKRLHGLDRELYANGQHGESKLHFLVAEGDRVVALQEFATVAKNGKPYRNEYCFIFRLEGDKVAEVIELSDTLYVKETCLA